MIGTLYAGVISVLILLFQYINVAFPDVLSMPYPAVLERIRWAEAMLVVVFPVFLFISWLLERDMMREPAKRDSRVRKWLIYFTLFLSAVTIIVDLITLIYNFLGGDLGLSFFLKTVAVLAVAGAVFGYYFWELKRRSTERTMTPRYAAVGSTALMLAAVIAGFFIVGSPATQRARRFDAQRVMDLQQIQSEVINYWTYKDALPKTTDELKNSITGFSAPADPETGALYTYRPTADLSFELCATFTTDEAHADRWSYEPKLAPPLYPDMERSLAYRENNNWAHGEGRQCFTRTIDPAFYRPEKPTL